MAHQSTALTEIETSGLNSLCKLIVFVLTDYMYYMQSTIYIILVIYDSKFYGMMIVFQKYSRFGIFQKLDTDVQW